MRELDNNAHSVFLLYYHLILVVKYRKKVLNDPISDRAREIFEYIAPKYHITLEEWNHVGPCPYHVPCPSEVGTQQIYQCL